MMIGDKIYYFFVKVVAKNDCRILKRPFNLVMNGLFYDNSF